MRHRRPGTVVIVADRAFDATVDHVWFPSFTRFAPGALAALARLPHLRSASFADTDLDDAALAEVARAVTIDNVNVQGTRISNDGLAHLSALPRLAHLRLKDNPQLDDRCVQHLLALRHLVELQVHETSIGRAGLDQLVHLPSLRVLIVDLRGEVTLEFLRALSARMPRCAVTIKGRGELRAGEWA